MKKTLFIMVLLFLLVLFTVKAQSSYVFQENSAVDLKISCFDENNSLCNSGTACQITVFDSNHSLEVSNASMTWNYNYFNYSLNESLTNPVGEHYVLVTCQGSTDGYSTFIYEVARTRYRGSLQEAVIYGVLIFISLGLLLLCLYGGLSIDGRNEFNLGGDLVKINYGKYAKIGLFYLGYLLLWVLTFFLWQVSDKYLLLDTFTNVLNISFIVITVLAIPLFLVFSAVMIVKTVLDFKLHKLAKRGLKPRK